MNHIFLKPMSSIEDPSPSYIFIYQFLQFSSLETTRAVVLYSNIRGFCKQGHRFSLFVILKSKLRKG